VVPLAGSVQDTGDVFVPWRLADAAGAVVEPVSAFLADLQASGRSEATLKSYCKALLRWFRFLWAISVPWDQATRAEARVILSPASGRGSDLRGCVEVTVLDAAAAVFRFFACRV
jgi:hypothetical protein